MTGDGMELSLRGVAAGYGRYLALHDVHLDVPAGVVSAVLGPNGAGKSTLLRAVMGLVPDVRGSIRLGGVDIAGRRADKVARLGVGFVPEGRGILNSLTVRENLLLAARNGGRRGPGGKQAGVIDAAVQRFPVLEQRLDQPAGQLSGGQQQMLSIARALAGKPRLLLIDEPSLGLAPIIRKQLAEVLRAIAEQDRLAVLLAEQDVSLAGACATRAYVLRLGRVTDELSQADMQEEERLRSAYLGSAPASAPNPEAGS